MSVRAKLLPLSAAVLMMAGCASWPQTEALLRAPGELPPRAAVAGLEFQSHVDDQGAPGALAMALNWAGKATQARMLVPDLAGDSKQRAILDLATRHGRLAYPVHSLPQVLAELAAGHPVLTLQEPSGRPDPRWRYALLVGYDLERARLYAHSGVLQRLPLPLQVFEGNWQRAGNWGVVILPPGRLPATAAESDYLAAAARLADRGAAWEAVVAHDAALTYWPNSSRVYMGLARSLWTLGDSFGALAAYESAALLAADPSPALAQIGRLRTEIASLGSAAPPPSAGASH